MISARAARLAASASASASASRPSAWVARSRASSALLAGVASGIQHPLSTTTAAPKLKPKPKPPVRPSDAGRAASLAFALGAGLCLLQQGQRELVDMECSECDKDDDATDPAEEESQGYGSLPGTKDASAAWGGGAPEKGGLLSAQKILAAEQAYRAVLEEVEREQKKKDREDEEREEGEAGDIPHHVPEHFREELMGALDRSAPLSSTARYHLTREANYPIERAEMTFAPEVPRPIKRDHPVHMVADITCISKKMKVTEGKKYEYWPFGVRDRTTGKVKVGVPGPMIRARVGDVLQVNFTNEDESGMAHSIDFHSVSGPGGGSPTNFAEQDETKTGAYLLRKPGLYIYHCAAAPIPVHIHNGMFGLILVEPPEGLPPVDKEFYVVQHELYVEESDDPDERNVYDFDYQAALDERPKHVLFNGREGALVDRPMIVDQNDRVRIYFGNAGPNLVSSIHLIGGIFDKVYREGGLIRPPDLDLQSTLVPAGAAAVLETHMLVPGSYSLIDHSIFRIDKGCVGLVKVKGKPRPDVYDSLEPPVYCPGCKTHQ